MPRAARIDIPGLFQHVIVRGVNRCDIFHDDDDRRRFLDNLSRLLVQTETDCFAWALMTNHVHLLLCPRKSRLAVLMRRLLTGYALYFNLRHNRSGHLFQNRYKSIVCDEDAYLLELVRYIHLNPLRAGLLPDIAALDNYPWSGHAVVVGNCKQKGQVVDEILHFFDDKKSNATILYRRFIADGIDQGWRSDLTTSGRRLIHNGDKYDERILGDDDFIEQIRSRQECSADISPSVEIVDVIDRVCRHFSIDPELLLQRSRGANVNKARSIICYFAVRLLGHNGVSVGKHICLGRSGVSVAAGRGENMVKNDKALLCIINK